MKKSAAVSMAVLVMWGGSALTSAASAAPMKKCQDDPENFQIVNGKCVSDGQAEKLH